jgi:hypothetical protein
LFDSKNKQTNETNRKCKGQIIKKIAKEKRKQTSKSKAKKYQNHR